MGWMAQGSNTGRGKQFSLLQNHPARLWGPPSLLISGYWGKAAMA